MLYKRGCPKRTASLCFQPRIFVCLITLNTNVKKKAIVSVINDLATDQRVDRTCRTLVKLGYEVLLIGRVLPHSLGLGERPYSCHRMKLLFSSGPAFYAEYQVRLFLFLLCKRCSLLVSNDLDTLMPNYLIQKLFNIHIVYDSHEYFTGVPELQDRPLVRMIWKAIERLLFPRIKHILTVNHSIAKLYEDEYHQRPVVVRNIPRKQMGLQRPSREELRLPPNKPLLLIQGSGINVKRGAEEAVQAMAYLPEACLLIIGGGDVIPRLHELVVSLDLEERVFFLPKMPYHELMHYTASADIGLTLDKGDNINYKLSLPNKIFDYIQARIPILGSDLPEVSQIIRGYEIGDIIDCHDPAHIAEKARSMFSNPEKMAMWQEKLNIAAEALCWENEEKVLIDVFQSLT